MSALQSLYALTGTLVHPSAAASSPGRDRHQSFIALKLAATCATLGTAPFYLGFHGAPNAVGVLVFAFALLPLAAAMIAMRTGALVLSQAAAATGCVGLALALFFGTDVGIGGGLACLMVAVLEAEASADARLARAAHVVVAVAALGMAAAATRGTAAPDALDGAITGVLALAYATPLIRRTLSLSRMTQDSLRREAGRALAVAAALGDLLVWLDASGSVDHVSAACETLLGASPDALTGRGLFERIHVADRPAFLRAVDEAAHHESTVTALVRVRPMGGEPRHLWIEMRTHRVRAAGGASAGRAAAEVVAILRDVTAVRDHEAEIAKAQEAIETALRSKDHFLANMSHELRTPLNAIIGFSEILSSHTLRPADHEKQREYACIIHQSGQHLLSVVNSILDMSKIQSGTFTIIPEPFAVGPLMDLCCDMVALKASEGRVAIVRDYAAATEDVVADKRACKQILINLLSNAVKFTPEFGRVTLRGRLEGNALAITIADTGIGITAGDLERLGEPFFQARSSPSRPYEGTGLGLSVVRGLVGLHGGTIAVESEAARGTVVTVKLPLDCRVVAPAGAPAPIDTVVRRTPGPTIRSLTSGMKNIA